MKIGDRVRVVAPKTGWLRRPESGLGCTGLIINVHDNGDCRVDLDSGLSPDNPYRPWYFAETELAMENPMTDPMSDEATDDKAGTAMVWCLLGGWSLVMFTLGVIAGSILG